jgi:hypothetical protein
MHLLEGVYLKSYLSVEIVNMWVIKGLYLHDLKYFVCFNQFFFLNFIPKVSIFFYFD